MEHVSDGTQHMNRGSTAQLSALLDELNDQPYKDLEKECAEKWIQILERQIIYGNGITRTL